MILRTIIFISLFSSCHSQDAAFLGYGAEPKEAPSYHRPNKPVNYIPNGQFGLTVQFPEKRIQGREFGGTLEERDMSLELKERERIQRQAVKEDYVIEKSGPAGEEKLPSRGYRPPPPPVRRDINMPPRCSFDPEKWSYHAESSMTNAIMFHRETGIGCEECMKKCIEKQTGQWTCRSVVYDSKWSICDLFAITATYSPYFLVDYPGRDYFEFLSAKPATVAELGEMKRFVKEKEESRIVTCEALMEEKKKASGVKTSHSKVEEVETKTEGSLYGAVSIKELIKAEEKKEVEEQKKEIQDVKKERKVEKNKLDIVTAPVEEKTENAAVIDEKEVARKTEFDILEEKRMRELGEEIERESMEKKDKEDKVMGEMEKTTGGDPRTNEQTTTTTSTSTSTAASTTTEGTTTGSTTTSTESPTTTTTPTIVDESKLKRTEIPEDMLKRVTVTTEQITTTGAPKTAKFLIGETDDASEEESSEEIAEKRIASIRIRPSAKMHGVKKTKFASRTSIDEVEEAFRDILIRPYPQEKNKKKMRVMSSNVKEFNAKHEELLVKEITRETSCSDDQAAGILVYESSTRVPFTSADVKRYPSRTLEQCVEKCKHDNDCSSAIFSPAGCEISSTKARAGTADITPSNSCFYIEKICIARKVANERVLTFPARPNHLLAGFVEEVTDAENIDRCVEMCMQSRERQGFHCLSAMYYSNQRIQNCVLNRESKETKPSRYILQEDVKSTNLIYFQLSDAVQLRKEKSDAEFRRKDSIAQSLFTIWSSCEGKSANEMRFRYGKCKDKKDIRQCPKESAFCGANQKRGPHVLKLTPEIEEEFRARAKA